MRESISAKAGGPKIGIQMNGMKRETYIHHDPQYGLSIGGINNSGYIDETDFEIAKAASPPPENEAEADTNNELGTSGDLAQEAINEAKAEER